MKLNLNPLVIVEGYTRLRMHGIGRMLAIRLAARFRWPRDPYYRQWSVVRWYL